MLQDLTRVRRLETVRRDFISNISHELRTPLAGLKALVDTLRDGALEDPPAARAFPGPHGDRGGRLDPDGRRSCSSCRASSRGKPLYDWCHTGHRV